MWDISAADWISIVGAILSLVLLEGLLSADNALVLAVMVRPLPKSQQKRALRYGIWGAFIFRAIAVVFATLLLEFWWLKVFGGCYLLYLAIHHFVSGGEEHPDAPRKSRFGQGFWATVINVELADIAFSIDSILAAVAMADALPKELEQRPLGFLGLNLGMLIIYIGGVLGIVMMRIVAGVFLLLLDRFKGLAAGAYVLVAWIGVKLIQTGLVKAFHPEPRPTGPTWRDQVPVWLREMPEMPEWLFWVGMIAILAASLLYKPRRRPVETNPTSTSVEDAVEHRGEPHA